MLHHEDVFPKKRHAYREHSDVDESAEMEVVKAILLREEYIKRIKANLNSQGSKFGKDQGAFGDLLGLIDLFRLTTVDACEAIQRWRKIKGGSSMPFIWKGMNYLLKIPIDLNFLDEQKLLRTWLSFSLKRNPFLCPVPLEKLAGISNATNTSGQRVFSKDKKSFFSVGGSTTCKQRTRDMLGGDARAPSSLRAGGSAIADGDMGRIGGAAATILHEEAMHGRYTVDSSSRFVPTESAEKLKFSRQLKLDDNRGIHMPANVSQDLAPFTDIAEIGRAPEEISTADLGEFSPSTGDRRDLGSSVGLSSSGKASAKRAGGRLRPVTVHSSPPRKRAPVIRRSVGAILRAEMLHRQQQNIHLQKELEDLRQHLSKAYSTSAEIPPKETLCLNCPRDGEINVPRDPASDSIGPDVLADVGEAASRIETKAEELKRRIHRQTALEEQVRIFQAKERDRENKKRAKVLERKRRLLEHDPDLLQPRVDDEYTLEDEAATRIQRIARGVQGRTRVRKLRPVLINAAVRIQAIIRGHLARSRVELKIVDMRSVTNIQRVWRGHRGRCATISNRRKLERTTAARDIQKIARGRAGRLRVDHKRGLRESAKNGAEVVGVKQLFHQDIVELADAVDALLVGHGSATSLPGVVLGLLKVVALMLEEDEESAAISRYSALGVKSAVEMQPALHFSWRDALSLLRRSSKLLRRLRQVAEGPASRRSRIVHFSQAAVRAYTALRCDQGWKVATIGRVGRGAKACQHLMMWVDALQDVFAYQREFADDLGSDRMPWVARAQQSLRCMRHLELSRMVWEHAVVCLQQVLHESRETAPKKSKHVLVAGDAKGRKGDLRLCVAENALKILKARATCAIDALFRMKHEEEDAQRNDEAREQLREETLVEDLNHAEANVEKSLNRLEEAKREARDGIETDHVHLQLVLDELATCEVVRRERWTSLEMFRTQRKRNDKRRGVDVEVWGNLRHQLRVVGELEAASFLAAEDLNFVRDGRDADGSTVPAGSRSHELKLLQARVNEATSLAVAAQTRLASMEEEQENAHAIASEAELHKEESLLPHEWDDAIEEEREEDLREDERCARWEAHAATQFLPPAMIARPFQRPRPMVICLSRDVPGTAKRKIVQQLESDLPGLTIHIDDARNMGLHVGDLQQALSNRYSVVCHVDIGVGETCRKAFLQRLDSVKEALIPTPNFILVVGDSKNRSGGPLHSSVGCTGQDLSVMGDGEIKKRLEDVARMAEEIQDPVFLEAMANMGQQVTPPSQSHVLVMEALIILLMPQTVFQNHVPFSSLRGVTWTEARHILGHPDKLWAAIARVDACNIPPVNLSTLQVYIEHDRWPHGGGASIGDGGVFEILAAWARSTIEISVLLTRAGGSPEALCHYSKAHIGLLAAVVPVHDEYFSAPAQWNPKINFKRGWRPAYYQALSAVLEDVRVFRVAKRIRGSQAEGVHLIEIYQECGRLFFHTYDPDSCVSDFCVVEETQISHLLAPTLDQPPEFGPSTVPCDRQDMFERLVALLSFEAARSNDTVGVSHLTCQRRLRRLMRDTRQISGHSARVTVYEEAKGELRYSLYLAEHAARIQLKVDATLLEKVLQDTSNETGERQAITSEDTCRLLVPITDRLGISPSRTAVSTMGASRGFHERKASSQGFILKIRHKGGPGRRVFRAVCLISGACHVLTAWELGRGGLLRLAAYDPTTSMTYETRLSKAERACLGYEGEDRKSWIKLLGRRLSLRRARGAIEAENRRASLPPRRTMILDKTVFSTACRVAAGRIDTRLFRMRAELVDAGRSLSLDLYQADTSKQCRIVVNSDDLVAVGLQTCTANAVVELGGGSEPDFKTTYVLIGPRCRETAIRQLTRHLRFDPECDSVTFSVNGGSRTTPMVSMAAVEHRRPQCSLKSAFLQPPGNPGSYTVGHYGLVEGFLKHRRQPRVLRHGYERAHSQESVGKKRMAATAPPREASTRKKGKQKRDKKHAKPVDEDKKPATAPSELSGRTTRENIATRTEASQLLQEEPLESTIDPMRSLHSGTAQICLPQDGERSVFQGAISIRRDDWEGHQPVCDTVVTVFESAGPDAQDGPDIDDKINLRAAVYYSKLAAYAEVSIKGFQDLRQVVGALHQSLAHEWRHQPKDEGATDALFKFIFHHRAMIVAGTWDCDRDGYVENGADFTVLLKRTRLYRSFKQTPIHLSGIKDTQANAHQLIDDASRRGKKVFRRAVNVSSTLFQVTAYELPAPEVNKDAAPTLRFIAYDPKTQVQLIAVFQPDVVLELGGGPYSPWIAQDKREVLAEILAQALRLKTGPDGSPTLVMPWSGENLAFVDEAQAGETSRPRRDKVLVCAKRVGLSRLEVFSTRVTNYEVVITVLAETNALSPVPASVTLDNDNEDGEAPTLTFNLYCSKLSQSVDIDLPCAMQKMMTGRSILQIPKGEARSSAIRRSARFLCISSPSPSSEGLRAEFLFAPQKPWLVAYNELDASDRPPEHRPRGQPLIFIPGDTDGDLIASKGISIDGFRVLLSVHTKERGRPGREGLVLEVYNAETSASSILHLSASHLLKQVDDKDHLLDDGRLLGTIDTLTKRLQLKKSATGAWELRMDRNLSPYLFMGM